MKLHHIQNIRAKASNFRLVFVLIIALLLQASCKKFVEVEAADIYTTVDDVFGDDENAIALLNGIYARMSSNSLTSGGSLNAFSTLYAGLSADEFVVDPAVVDHNILLYYQNNLNSKDVTNIWLKTFPMIYKVNDVIRGLSTASKLTPEVRKQLLGEARFLRGFCYFYLVNYYGPVPLATSVNYKENSLLGRSSVDEVYGQIIADLKAADSLMSEHFVGADGITSDIARVMPTKWAAKAMLARTYLYKKDYDKASALASEVINYQDLFSLTNLNDVFLANSQEAIWQLQPVNLGWNTEDARLFIIPESGPSDLYPVYLNNGLVHSFESNDQRLLKWVDTVIVNGINYFYPYKYKVSEINAPVTEYQMVLRLAEQFLIRAEANAELENFNEAINDLNAIRNRAGLANYSGAENKTAIVNAILEERRLELFSEWGHRWLDLKRTGNIDSVMTPATQEKGGSWNSFKQFFPVPYDDMLSDPNLTQNTGY